MRKHIKAFALNIQIILGGIVFITLGLSQAVFGWISDAVFAKVLYGLVGTGIGSLMFFGGAFALWAQFFTKHDTDAEEEVENRVQFTDAAIDKLRKYMSDYATPVRVGVKRKADGGFNHLLKVDTKGPRPGDVSFRRNGINVLVQEKDVPLLQGTLIDFVTQDGKSGFEFNNPNSNPSNQNVSSTPKHTKKTTSSKIPLAIIGSLTALIIALIGGSMLWAKNTPAATFDGPALTEAQDRMFNGVQAGADPKVADPKDDERLANQGEPSREPNDEIPPSAEITSLSQSSTSRSPTAPTDPVEPTPSKSAVREKRTAETEKRPDGIGGLDDVEKTRDRSARDGQVEPMPQPPTVAALTMTSEISSKRKILTACVSGNGTFAFIRNDANNIQVVNIATRATVFETKRLGIGSLETIAMSLDGLTLASGYYSGQVVVWDIKKSGKLAERIRLNGPGPVGCLAVGPDSQYVAAGSDELLVWDLAAPEVSVRQKLKNKVSSCLFPNDGTSVLFSDGGSVGAIDVSSMKAKILLEKMLTGLGHKSTLSPDGQRILVDTNTEVKLVELQSGKTVATIEKGGVVSMAFSPDGQKFALSQRREFSVWDTRTSKPIATNELTSGGNAVTFDPTGSQIFVSDERSKKLKAFELISAR